MRPFVIVLAFLFMLALPVFAEPLAQSQRINFKAEAPIVSEDLCVIQRFQIEIPKGTPDGFIELEIDGNDHGGCVYPSAKDAKQIVTVTVAAMLGKRQCVFHLDYATSHVNQIIPVTDKTKLSDVIHLDAINGEHDLEEKIRLGDYRGAGLYITVSPKAQQKANGL